MVKLACSKSTDSESVAVAGWGSDVEPDAGGGPSADACGANELAAGPARRPPHIGTP